MQEPRNLVRAAAGTLTAASARKASPSEFPIYFFRTKMSSIASEQGSSPTDRTIEEHYSPLTKQFPHPLHYRGTIAPTVVLIAVVSLLS